MPRLSQHPLIHYQGIKSAPIVQNFKGKAIFTSYAEFCQDMSRIPSHIGRANQQGQHFISTSLVFHLKKLVAETNPEGMWLSCVYILVVEWWATVC